MKWLKTVAVTLVAVFAACDSATEPQGPTYLYVQDAPTGSVVGDRLILLNPDPQTIYFSDRPDRITGRMTNAEFVSQWDDGPNSFAEDPPNGSVVFVNNGQENVVVLELFDPVLTPTQLSYRIRILQGTLPAALTDVALFIDPTQPRM
jgi:hypothetical protein